MGYDIRLFFIFVSYIPYGNVHVAKIDYGTRPTSWYSHHENTVDQKNRVNPLQ